MSACWSDLNGVAGLEIGKLHVGLKLMRPEQPRIDFQCPFDRRLRLGQLVVLQGERGQRGMDFGRLRIDCQSRLELPRRLGLVELFEI